MKAYFSLSHCVFPCNEIEKTCEFYVQRMGFRAVKYLECEQPHICLYRDNTEIILTKANDNKTMTNRELYGYGYDAYFITLELGLLKNEMEAHGVKIVRQPNMTDYNNDELVIEDCDRRWIGFGIKKE